MLVGLERLSCEGEVRLGRGRHDHDVERGVGEEVIQRGEMLDAWVVVGCGGLRCGASLQD